MPKPEDVGMCTKCKEYTSLGTPCCGAPVDFEGSTYTYEDLEKEEEYTDEELADNAAELSRECQKDDF